MVTYTSSSTYWAPLKPRIRIYELNDSSYSSPLYTYNAFTDSGSTTKPIALNFDNQTSNVGTFSIEIEDGDYELDPDTFMRGNRVFIDCSKDGSTFLPAFKGLVRGTDQNVYATSGRNLVINGYSFQIRLNERIINCIKESATSSGAYNRNDPNMLTHNLIENLLDINSNYVYSQDDTELYSLFKHTNVVSSSVKEWLPRLDAQLVTVNDAMNSILEYSNSLLMFNPTNDELMLYNPDLPAFDTDIFLLTDQMNMNADNADYTMYPLEPYSYNISYDYPDSGSRLIGSIGNFACPEEVGTFTESPSTDPAPTQGFYYMYFNDTVLGGFNGGDHYTQRWTGAKIGNVFKTTATQTNCSGLQVGVTTGVFYTSGNNSANLSGTSDYSSITPPRLRAKIYTRPTSTSEPSDGVQVGADFFLHKDGVIGKPFPAFQTYKWTMTLAAGDVGVSGLTPDTVYWLVLEDDWAQAASWRYYYDRFVGQVEIEEDYTYENMSPGLGWATTGIAAADTWPYSTTTNTARTTWDTTQSNSSTYNGPLSGLDMTFDTGAGRPECGGTQATLDTDPVFAVAHDLNMSKRLGMVERVISNLPTHIKTRQTLVEYLGQKLYYAAKPRFTFDYPSVSMPNKIPKAGDIITHVDSKTRTGIIEGALQTGVIESIQYSFEQGSGGDNDALGLRKLSIVTTGIKRGSY